VDPPCFLLHGWGWAKPTCESACLAVFWASNAQVSLTQSPFQKAHAEDKWHRSNGRLT
jgi:hypothetical protein